MEPQMHTDAHRLEVDRSGRLNSVTSAVIGGAYRVINSMGSGFLEKVYENALALELRHEGLRVVQQQPMQVWYRQQVVGEYVADLVVEDDVIVELKAVQALDRVHLAQCLNYLKATGKPICLLLNFGCPQLEIKRVSL
jgi:GxxExxY protein